MNRLAYAFEGTLHLLLGKLPSDFLPHQFFWQHALCFNFVDHKTVRFIFHLTDLARAQRKNPVAQFREKAVSPPASDIRARRLSAKGQYRKSLSLQLVDILAL